MLLDEACASSSITAAVIKENALLLHDGRETRERRKYIYPEMNFSCNGTVT